MSGQRARKLLRLSYELVLCNVIESLPSRVSGISKLLHVAGNFLTLGGELR